MFRSLISHSRRLLNDPICICFTVLFHVSLFFRGGRICNESFYANWQFFRKFFSRQLFFFPEIFASLFLSWISSWQKFFKLSKYECENAFFMRNLFHIQKRKCFENSFDKANEKRFKNPHNILIIFLIFIADPDIREKWIFPLQEFIEGFFSHRHLQAQRRRQKSSNICLLLVFCI